MTFRVFLIPAGCNGFRLDLTEMENIIGTIEGFNHSLNKILFHKMTSSQEGDVFDK